MASVSNVFTGIMCFLLGLCMLVGFNGPIQWLLNLFDGTMAIVATICYFLVAFVMIAYMPLHSLTAEDKQ